MRNKMDYLCNTWTNYLRGHPVSRPSSLFCLFLNTNASVSYHCTRSPPDDPEIWPAESPIEGGQPPVVAPAVRALAWTTPVQPFQLGTTERRNTTQPQKNIVRLTASTFKINTSPSLSLASHSSACATLRIFCPSFLTQLVVATVDCFWQVPTFDHQHDPAIFLHAPGRRFRI
jgi:hypothetical protein